MRKQWSFARKFIFSNIIAGLIGNAAFSLVVWLAGLGLEFVLTNLVLWIVLLAILLAFTFFIIWQQDRKRFQSDLASVKTELSNLKSDLGSKMDTLNVKVDGKNQLLSVEELVVKILPGLVTASNLEEEMNRLMKKLLALATLVVPEVYGASLYRPDANKEWLTIWVCYEVPEDSLKLAKCYIGSTDPQRKRGVAGEAFVAKKLLVAHKTGQRDSNKHWLFDQASYIHFPEEATYPTFKSFICIPLFTGEDPHSCLGVVCFDSANLTPFDPPEIQETLQQLGSYIATLLHTYEELKQKRASP